MAQIQPQDDSSILGTADAQPANVPQKKSLAEAMQGMPQPVTAPSANSPANLSTSLAQAQPVASSVSNSSGGGAQGRDMQIIGDMFDQAQQNVKAFDSDKVKQANDAAFAKLKPDSPEMQEAMKPYNAQLNNIADQMQQIRQQQNDVVNSNEWAHLGETLGNAMTQYAAGLYGAKHGVDISGVKYSQTDWEARMKNRIGMMDNQLKDLAEQRGIATKQADEQQGVLKAQAERESNIALVGEKERTEKDYQSMNNRTKAVADAYISQVNAANANARMAQQMSMQFAHMDRQGQEFAINNMDKSYKQQGAQLKGLDQAVGILTDYAKGNIQDNDKSRMELNKALGQAGIDPSDLEKNMEYSRWFGLSTGSDPQKGVQYLQQLKAKYQDAAQQTYQAYAPIYKKVTGTDLPPEHVSKVGSLTSPAQPQQQAALQQSGPQPGTVQGGYKFNGGNPADKNNWEKVQ